MLQREAKEQKAKYNVHCKADALQNESGFSKRLSNTGTSQTMQGMHIKYRSGEKPVIQMKPEMARKFRQIAYNISKDPGTTADYKHPPRTVGVSNNMFAITPVLGGKSQMVRAWQRSENRAYAGPVPGGNQAGNHAERKLIYYDSNIKEIGVDREICQSCINAICSNAGVIEHVSDPTGTYAVYQNVLLRVGR